MKIKKGQKTESNEIAQMKKKNSVGQTFLSDRTDRNVCSTGLKIKRRKLPHWTLQGATHFITFRTHQVFPQTGVPVLLSIDEQKLVLEHIKEGDGKFYKLIAVVVMPDYVHLLLTPMEGYSLSRIMKGIKGVSARQINLRRRPTDRNGRTDKNVCSTGSIWKDESFDRIIRNQKEFDEKLNYMFYNPMKKGLTKDPWSYYGWYFNETQKI